MKTTFFTLLSLCCLLSIGCNKEENCLSGDRSLDQYISDKGLMVTEGDNGLRYIITNEGGAEKPVLSDTIVFNYQGYTTDEEIFDASRPNTPAIFQLDGLIQGWKQGIPLIGEGGAIRLFVPSNLAYGSRMAGDLCPNTDLIFDIELVEFY